MFNPAAALEQLSTEARNRTSWAIVEGAALRGELGEQAQRVALESWAEQYRALKAAGRVAEAQAIKVMVLRVCGVE
jgi:hypothetical protein